MYDRLSKSTTFISILLIGICLLGYFLVNTITSEPEQVVEQEIKITPYQDYDWSNLKGEEIKTYSDKNYTSMFGIDVAAHQDVIDWNKVKEAGVEFAYIRLGYRGAIEGKLNIDGQFEYNYKNAKAAGIKVGIYWYSQPVSELEAMAEANFVIDVLANREIDLPIAYDFEETMFADEYSRIHGMSKNNCTAMALAFCNEMSRNNYKTILYCNQYWADECYDWSILDKYQVWYAQYDVDYPQFDKQMVMWQYSDSGQIPGISKDCDLDIMFIHNHDQN